MGRWRPKGSWMRLAVSPEESFAADAHWGLRRAGLFRRHWSAGESLQKRMAAMFPKVWGYPKIVGGWFLDLSCWFLCFCKFSRLDGQGMIWNLLVPLINHCNRQMTKLFETALGCSYSVTCFQVLYRIWPSNTCSTRTSCINSDSWVHMVLLKVLYIGSSHNNYQAFLVDPLKVSGCWLFNPGWSWKKERNELA